MRALTIWQPWASLIAYEAKPFEFRKRPAPQSLVGQRIAIHAGKRVIDRDEVADLMLRIEKEDGKGTALIGDRAMPVLERFLASPGMFPRASILCTALLGTPRKATALFGGQVADSDRIDQHVWGWPLTEIQRLRPPVPATGAQGFWHWHGDPAEGAAP